MGWLIALCVLILLALMPLGVRVRYDENGVLVAVIVGFVKITLFPRKPKEKKDNKNKESAVPEKKPKKEKSEKKKNTSGGSITDFLPLVKIGLDFLNGFRLRLRINHLRLKLILGGGDPCDLALNYGKGWAALGNLMPLIERAFVIKKRDLEVECDFTADRTTVIAGADITIRLWHVIALAILHAPGAIKQFLSIMNKRKGGAKT